MNEIRFPLQVSSRNGNVFALFQVLVFFMGGTELRGGLF